MRQTLGERIAATQRWLGEESSALWSVRMLEESPEGRAVVEFSAGTQQVIAKYGTDDRGESTFQLLRAIAAAETAVLRVPEPLAWLEAPAALLSGRAFGAPLRRLHVGSSDGTLWRVGRALAELHGLTVPVNGRKQMADHVAELIRPTPTVLAQALPEFADTIHEAVRQLLDGERRWGAASTVPLHRDFHLRQLFDDGTHITVIDWDDAASGDPAFDVGYFTAYLRTHYGAEDAEQGIAAFRTGYGEAGGLWSRVPLWERFNYLRRACRRFRLQDPGWQPELESMLDRLAI